MDQYNTAHPGTFNLKGFMVGNGCTDWNVDTTPAYLEMGYWHGLLDDATHDRLSTGNCYQ